MIDIDRLQGWFLKHQRDLPFRDDRDPYLVWVSEVMLQQTQVETVIPFFVRFKTVFPNVRSLSESDPEVLQKLTEGLGYYRRFKLMREAALMIMRDYGGVFPKTYDDLIRLPGIGEYTAGAIMSIAYQKPYAATDGNVIRVISRVMGIKDDMRIPANRKRINTINQAWIMRADPRLYTEALMELGALVCTPKKPQCEQCPLKEACRSHQQQMVESVPFLSKKPSKTVITYVTLILEDNDHYIMRKRTEQLLEGMYEWPQFEAESSTGVLASLSAQGIEIEITKTLPEVTHVFTHRIWKMSPYRARLIQGMDQSWMRIRKSDLKDKPMAVAHSKIPIE